MRYNKYLRALALLAVAGSASALTIGPVRGDVWLGQALDVWVPVVFDPSEQTTASCVHAEVSYGDTAVDSRYLRITPEPGSLPDSLRLRMAVSAPVNDAIVNVSLHVGCEQRVTRRFQLLPDLPPRAAAAPALPLVPVPDTAAEPSEPAPAAVPAPPQRAPAPTKLASAASSKAAASAPRPRKPAASTPPPTPAAAPVAPRLSLEPVTVPERPSAPDPAVEAQVSEVLAAQAALQKLRQDYQGLQLQASRTEAEFAALRQHLAEAESERNTALAVAGGGFGILVALVAGALLWWGKRARVPAPDRPAEDEEALMSDLFPVAADKWMAPRPFQPDLEEEPVSVVELDLELPETGQPASQR